MVVTVIIVGRTLPALMDQDRTGDQNSIDFLLKKGFTDVEFSFSLARGSTKMLLCFFLLMSEGLEVLSRT